MKRLLFILAFITIASSAFAVQGFYDYVKVVNKKTSYNTGETITFEIENTLLAQDEKFRIILQSNDLYNGRTWYVDTVLSKITSMGNNIYRVGIVIPDTMFTAEHIVRLYCATKSVDYTNGYYRDLFNIKNVAQVPFYKSISITPITFDHYEPGNGIEVKFQNQMLMYEEEFTFVFEGAGKKAQITQKLKDYKTTGRFQLTLPDSLLDGDYSVYLTRAVDNYVDYTEASKKASFTIKRATTDPVDPTDPTDPTNPITSVNDALVLPTEQGNYSIYTTSGQVVASYTGAGLTQDLLSGVYLYKFEGEKGFKSGKYVVTK